VKTVVISQPMLFPWVGMLEQWKTADVFVHYNDVQFSKGSFTNRVQFKSASGTRWLTLPTKNLHLGQLISEVQLDNKQPWRAKHLGQFSQAYEGAPHLADALALMERVYATASEGLADLVIQSMEVVADYFGLVQGRAFPLSADLAVPGASWPRVLDIVTKLGGDVYVTGHGARNYLDHAAFAARGVTVKYLDYQKTPYPQLHGAFNPYVSALDLVANCGKQGARFIHSTAVDWKEFLSRG